MQPYNDGFKARMVQRMTGANAISAMALSRDVGVPQVTLSQWLRNARTLGQMTREHGDEKGAPRRPKDWTAEERLNAVMDASSLKDSALGEFLRKKGLHEAQIKEWREAIFVALGVDAKRTRGKQAPGDAKRILQLEKELLRKDRALAEVTALLVLKKKLDALMGVEDDDTPPRKGT